MYKITHKACLSVTVAEIVKISRQQWLYWGWTEKPSSGGTESKAAAYIQFSNAMHFIDFWALLFWTKLFTGCLGLVLKLLETICMHFMLVSQYYLKRCIWWNAGLTKTILPSINGNKIRFLLAKEPLKQELSYQVIMQVLPIPWETPGAAFCINGARRKKMKVLYLFKGPLQKIISFIYTQWQG